MVDLLLCLFVGAHNVKAAASLKWCTAVTQSLLLSPAVSQDQTQTTLTGIKPRSVAMCTCWQRVHAQEEQHVGQGIIGKGRKKRWRKQVEIRKQKWIFLFVWMGNLKHRSKCLNIIEKSGRFNMFGAAWEMLENTNTTWMQRKGFL